MEARKTAARIAAHVAGARLGAVYDPQTRPSHCIRSRKVASPATPTAALRHSVSPAKAPPPIPPLQSDGRFGRCAPSCARR